VMVGEGPRHSHRRGVGALSMHTVPPAIRIGVVLTGVTVMLGFHNPPHSWTSTVGPSLPGFSIAPCVDSLLYYGIDQAALVYPSRESQSLRYIYTFRIFTY
jgi:hypothetical protein